MTQCNDLANRIIQCSHPPVHTAGPTPSAFLVAIIGFALRVAPLRWLLIHVLAKSNALSGWGPTLHDAVVASRHKNALAKSRFWASWLESVDSGRARTARFVSTLTEPATILPKSAQPAAGDLFVLTPGAPSTVVNHIEWPPDHVATVLDLNGLLANDEAGAAPPRYHLYPARMRTREVVEGWFTEAKDTAVFAVQEIVAALPQGEFQEFTRRQTPLLTMYFKHAIAGVLRAENEMERALEKCQPQRVIILEGYIPAEAYIAMARKAGIADESIIVVAACPQPALQQRREARNASPSMDGNLHTNKQSGPEALTALKQMVDGLNPLTWTWTQWHKSWKNSAIVCVDLRSNTDFRHRGSSIAILRELAKRKRTIVLQPYGRLTRPLFHAVRNILTLSGFRAQPAMLRVPQNLFSDRGNSPWRAELLKIITPKLMNSGILDPHQMVGALEAIGVALTRFTPSALASVQKIAKKMQQDKAAMAIAVPSGKVPQAILASAAREAGVRSLEVQTLLIGLSERDNPPIADGVSVLDDQQKKIVIQRFGISPKRIVMGGRNDFAHKQTMRNLHEACSSKPYKILFASQPLGDLPFRTLEVLLEALSERTDIELLVCMHPDESNSNFLHFSELLKKFDRPVSIQAGGTPDALVAHCDLLVTIASNIALHAAVMNRPVLIMDVSDEGLPIRLDQYGIALAALSLDETRTRVFGLLDDHDVREKLANSRDEFFSRNQHLLIKNPVAAMLKFLDNLEDV